MLTPFITAYPSEVTSKNALYQVRFSLTPAAGATVLPVSVALSLRPSLPLKHADFDIVWRFCAQFLFTPLVFWHWYMV